jgi:hypothetical protein
MRCVMIQTIRDDSALSCEQQWKEQFPKFSRYSSPELISVEVREFATKTMNDCCERLKQSTLSAAQVARIENIRQTAENWHDKAQEYLSQHR